VKVSGRVEAEDDHPIVGIVGPLATGDEVGRGAEGCEQRRDGTVTPRDEGMVAVRLGAKQRDECIGILGADGAVERKAGGAAERLEREARADAVGGVGAGVERVDAQVEAAVVEGLEVVDVGAGAGFACGCELAAEWRLLCVAHDEDGVAREAIVRDGRCGVERKRERGSEDGCLKRHAVVELHSIIVSESEARVCEISVNLLDAFRLRRGRRRVRRRAQM